MCTYLNTYIRIMRHSILSVLLCAGTFFTASPVEGQLTLNDEPSAVGESNSRKDQTPVATITGKVTDEAGLELIGVAIQPTEALGSGTVTDVDGNYSLSVDDLQGSLRFSYTGYETKVVEINNRTVINVEMASSNTILEEVVVIGYGTREARDLTGAISTVGADEIEKSPSVSPEAAIQGRLPGVYISTPGGNPGARPDVQIRGVGTFGNAQPLYVIDGVPVTEFANGAPFMSREGDLRGNVNILSFINPADIESVSVLKDASAAAIYGVRAANGVVLITTKRGKSGAPRVSFDASYGLQEPVNRYDVLNVDQYVDLYTEAINNDANEELPAVFDPSSPEYLGDMPFVDWQDAVTNDNSTVQNYGARLSGGSESTQYYLSAGYSYQESPFVENDLERYSFSGSFDSDVSKLIKVGANFRVGYIDANDNTRFSALDLAQAAPWQPLFLEDGSPAPVQEYEFEPNENFNISDPASGAPFNIVDSRLLYGPETSGNPFGIYETVDNTYSILRNLGTGFVEINPLAGLRLRGTLSLDYYTNRQKEFTGFDRYLFGQSAINPYAGQDGTSLGSYYESTTRNFNLVREFSIGYRKQFGAHSVDVLLNAMDQRYTFQSVTASTGQMVQTAEELRTINGPTAFTGVSGQREETTLQGYMARVSYDFGKKYYLDLTVRRDGSSRFAPDFRWGTFPSVAAAWRVTAEPWMESNGVFDDLKIRAGWGKLGNQETAAFAFLSTISLTPDYAFGSGEGNPVGGLLSGARLPNFPNRTLSWETSTTWNIGVDAYALQNKLAFTVEYYNRFTDGILQSSNLAPSVGNEFDPIINVASVRNSGIEVSATYRNKIGQFSYGVSANLTTVKNRVEGLFNDEPFGGGFRTEIGQPLGYIFGYKVDRILRDQADVDAYYAENSDVIAGDNLRPGDIVFQDLNSRMMNDDGTTDIVPVPDGVVDDADRVFLGSVIPDHYYGVNFDFGYANFDLSVFFQGVGGVQRYNFERSSLECMCGRGDNQSVAVLNRWTPENTDTDIPRAVVNPAGNLRFSDRFVENAGFMRLRNVQLGYSLSPSTLESLSFLQSLRVYVTGTNLFTVTDWTGIDPEATDVFVGGIVPPTRAVVFGINASF